MKAIAFGAAVLLAMISVASAQAQEAPKTYLMTFEGESKVTLVPDQVQIDFVVKARNNDGQKARAEQAASATKALEFLKGASVPEKNVKMCGYSYQPVYEWRRNGENNDQFFAGYLVEQSFRVTAPVVGAPDLIDGITNQGFIGSVQFLVSNADQVREQTLKSAIADAKAKAKKRAGELDIKLGKIVGYSELRGHDYSRYDGGPRAASARSGGPPVPVGESEIRISVQLTYELAK